MSLDKATVAGIASLARIRVGEEELEDLAGELSKILDFVEQLEEVDTENVEAMASVAAMELRRRADEVTEGDQRDKILANAPEATAGFFTVPKVVE
ncbi:MAG: Asp-tRNA(Asn)/Glu-tRNA(Gln) amidotransferase subunit GatC [Alphaproteobacteria bacterium]|nr:Asp-tRNA(Asn)/Glu-tRNA(Gln) amidotransferase subunit GatC [Alphaproteobacteria bacterium]